MSIQIACLIERIKETIKQYEDGLIPEKECFNKIVYSVMQETEKEV